MAISTAALNWYVPYGKLDKRQQDFVDTYQNGQNVLLQGPPGSGKTILLVNLINRMAAAGKKVGLVTYTRSLIDMLNTGLETSAVRAMTYFDFKKDRFTQYDLLVVDEVQDLPADVLAQIRAQAKRIVVAGDVNQQIFDGCGEDVILQQLGLDPVKEQFRIAVSYRLTPSVFRAARVFMPHVLEAAESNGKTDVKPEIGKADNWIEEVKYVYHRSLLGPQKGEVSAILIPTREGIISFANTVLAYLGKSPWSIVNDSWGKPDFGKLNAHLASCNVPLEVVQNNFGSLESIATRKRVVLQTYHSAKGLDYNNVCLPGLSGGAYIGSPETALLYVALTRSRATLCATYHGAPHTALRRIENLCAAVQADVKRLPGQGGSLDDDF